MAALFKEIQPVLAYVAAHLDDQVPLATLAGQAGRSPFHLHRVFSAVVGETPKRFSLRLRLGRAAVMLLTTADSVLDIGLACGFQSHEAFSRAFRRQFRITPSGYRERGFTHAVDKAQARQHAALVDQVGPCIGLYRMSEEMRDVKNETTYSITKKDLTPQPVLLVRRKVKRSEIAAAIGEALPHIFMYAQEHGIALAGHPLTRYIDVGPGLITMEPAMRITEGGSGVNAGSGEVVVDTLPGGPAAVTMHSGPYDTLPEAYAAIEEWMQAEGLKAGGAPWESYVTDPGEYPDPRDWKTEVFWPLAGQ